MIIDQPVLLHRNLYTLKVNWSRRSYGIRDLLYNKVSQAVRGNAWITRLTETLAYHTAKLHLHM